MNPPSEEQIQEALEEMRRLESQRATVGAIKGCVLFFAILLLVADVFFCNIAVAYLLFTRSGL